MLPLLKKFMKSYEDLDKHIQCVRGHRPYKGVDLDEILNFQIGMTDPEILQKLNDVSSDEYPTYESVPVELRKNTFKIYYDELKNNPMISEERQKEILAGIVQIGQDQEFKKLAAHGKYHMEFHKDNPIDHNRSYLGLFLKCIREIIAFVPRVAWTVGHSAIKLSFQNHMCNPLNTASRNKINNLTKVVAELEQEENSLSSQVGKVLT